MILLIIFLDDFHKESLCKIPVYFLDSSFLFFFFFTFVSLIKVYITHQKTTTMLALGILIE